MSTPVRDRRLASRPVFTDQVVVIVSPQHRLAARRRVALTDCSDETVLIYPPRQESLFLQKVLGPAGVVPARVQEVKLTEAIIEMVKANLGISALARWAVQPFLDSGAVVALPVSARGPAAALVGRDAEGPGRGRLRGGVHRSARARQSGWRRAGTGDEVRRQRPRSAEDTRAETHTRPRTVGHPDVTRVHVPLLSL